MQNLINFVSFYEADCWAIGLHRGHSASCKQAGIDGPVPTSDEIVEGVDAAYQVSGEGIRRLKHAATFMQKYCKEMIVHRRPRGDDVALFEGFERFLIDISSEIPVMVTVECVPGFNNFNGHVSNLFFLSILVYYSSVNANIKMFIFTLGNVSTE